MRVLLTGTTFVIGLGLALHLSMNASIGAVASNVRMANALFWCVGAGAAVALGATGYEQAFWERAAHVPPLFWFAGAMGACFIFGITFLIPRLGAATVSIALLAGQVLGSLVIARLGLLSSPVEPLNPARVIGAVVMLAGAGLALFGRWPHR